MSGTTASRRRFAGPSHHLVSLFLIIALLLPALAETRTAASALGEDPLLHDSAYAQALVLGTKVRPAEKAPAGFSPGLPPGNRVGLPHLLPAFQPAEPASPPAPAPRTRPDPSLPRPPPRLSI